MKKHGCMWFAVPCSSWVFMSLGLFNWWRQKVKDSRISNVWVKVAHVTNLGRWGLPNDHFYDPKDGNMFTAQKLETELPADFATCRDPSRLTQCCQRGFWKSRLFPIGSTMWRHRHPISSGSGYAMRKASFTWLNSRHRLCCFSTSPWKLLKCTIYVGFFDRFEIQT